MVPLHEHIIAQGFLEMVREVDKRALLYSDEEPRRVSADPLNPSRSRAGNTRGDLAEWVREIGVTDRRHTFKQIGDRHDIKEHVLDTIVGHKPRTAGRGYMLPTLKDRADALDKFPRYTV